MGKRNRAALLPTNLPQLQNLIKRDPLSYKDDFLQQYRHYESQLSIFKLKPSEGTEEFSCLIIFIAQVADCYPQETSTFPQNVIDILSENYQIMHPDLRKTLVQSLVMLRNKDIIPSSRLSIISLLHLIPRTRQATSRLIIQLYYRRHKKRECGGRGGVNSGSMSSCGSTMSDHAIAAKKSLDVCIELYRKGIWNDAKTVNVISEGCFHSVTKIKVAAIQFFLGNDLDDANGSSDDEGETPDIKRLQHINLINKKKKSTSRKMEKAKAVLKKQNKKKSKPETFNFSALHLINDSQGFAEKLFSSLQKSSNNDRFEVKLMTMNLISRIIGVHKLTLLGFYPYIMRYIQPHQRDVTMVLVVLAQATHELVPPDTLEPALKAIANNFVSDHCASEVITVGLNAIREICQRQPLAIDATLLQDLTEYKSSKEKSVIMAARSLIGLYREVNPEMLKSKDRGKEVSMNIKEFKPLQYGEVRSIDRIAGIELLEEYKERTQQEGGVVQDEWAEWEIASSSENPSSDGEWIDVTSDGNDIVITDNSNSNSSEDEADEDENNEASPDGKTDTPQNKEMISENSKDTLKIENQQKPKMSNLATTRLLTPADFARLEKLRLEQAAQVVEGSSNRKRKRDTSTTTAHDDFIDVNQITGPRKKAKQDYEERLESIKAGREGREKYGSSKGKKKQEGASKTNKEKAKNKAFMMVVHKKNVLCKKKPSLREKQMHMTKKRYKSKRK
ncbi:1649_t:CDS:10 [Ambispora gerdemannii]|uniref:Protein SDA1 n=1 Tax=Ambispora gerdemannii TaxID=144530 RepID=A0A9N8VW99_9GLOM|nr:1649_t:CDS:10 [Ambispora gerdemannii]